MSARTCKQCKRRYPNALGFLGRVCSNCRATNGIADRVLLRVARDFRKGILGGRCSCGMCAAICWPLSGFLSQLGVRARLEELRFGANFAPANHVVLRLPDGRILDPTADQFGLAAVYLGPMPALYDGLVAEGTPT